ncbi:SsrA-binding protein SmpB [Rhabdothermincola sediminis]|uniref:SsrA-binding protein SmpB n=1 Tax=Rhabdothermincola sediminis TaxID=2751370 RepID=UPI0027DA03EE|nr:SsrA-binding protein SmpB [Rhabdothermincola sediminis]
MAGTKIIATNRQARRDYDILDHVEAGLVLRGSEVKSLREAKVQLADAYARIDGGEAWLVGLHIAPWRTAATHSGHDPERRRKLLLHRDEIERLRARLDQERLTMVPLSLYFKDGRAKVELALAKPRRKGDKRQAIAARDARREAEQAIGRALKGRE